MVAHAPLVDELQDIVSGKYAFAPPDQSFAVDGLNPQVVVDAGSYDDVAAVLRYANARGLAVIPQGGRWFISVGNVPRAYDIALSIRRLDGIVEYEPADMTVTCQAGISGGRLNAHLEQHGQMVPFIRMNPDDNMTIGGLLAMNHSFMRLPHGAPRDFTIGLRVVTPDGRISRAGGRVVKNVAGYDLCKLHIGAMGTLGVIVEATFKTFPSPLAREDRSLEFGSLRDACEFVFEAERRGTCLVAAPIDRRQRADGDRFVPVSGYILNITLAGSPAAVARSCRELDEMAAAARVKALDPDLLPNIEGMPEWARRGDPLNVRATVPRSKVPDLVKALEAEPRGVFFDPIDPALGRITTVWLGLAEPEEVLGRFRALVTRLGGTLLVIKCSDDLKRRIDVFGDPPPAFELMRRVKHQFDPNGILSPGRFVGRL